LGGIGSPHGILFGAAMMTFLPELVDAIPGLPTTILGALRAIVFASLLLLIVLFRPKGLFGKIEMPPGFGE
jgi:branched-chain amino acid transport system permease protein